MTLTNKDLKPKGCVYYLNKLGESAEDFEDLRSKFEDLGFICFDISHITSYNSLSEKVQEFGKEKGLDKDLPMMVFFYGFGSDNNIYLDSESGETISYKTFAEAFSVNWDENGVLILFTTTCLEKQKQNQHISNTSEENIGNVFHICVKVSRECANLSLMKEAVLIEIEEMKTPENMEDFVYNVLLKIKELQKSSMKGNGYVADIRFYGVNDNFYFEKTSDEMLGQDGGQTRLEIKKGPSLLSEEDLKFLDNLLSCYQGEENMDMSKVCPSSEKMTFISSECSFQMEDLADNYSDSDGAKLAKKHRFDPGRGRSSASTSFIRSHPDDRRNEYGEAHGQDQNMFIQQEKMEQSPSGSAASAIGKVAKGMLPSEEKVCNSMSISNECDHGIQFKKGYTRHGKTIKKFPATIEPRKTEEACFKSYSKFATTGSSGTLTFQLDPETWLHVLWDCPYSFKTFDNFIALYLCGDKEIEASNILFKRMEQKTQYAGITPREGSLYDLVCCGPGNGTFFGSTGHAPDKNWGLKRPCKVQNDTYEVTMKMGDSHTTESEVTIKKITS